MRFLCLLFGHLRSRGHARYDGFNWRTVCKRCGADLVRVDGEWIEPKSDS